MDKILQNLLKLLFLILWKIWRKKEYLTDRENKSVLKKFKKLFNNIIKLFKLMETLLLIKHLNKTKNIKLFLKNLETVT